MNENRNIPSGGNGSARKIPSAPNGTRPAPAPRQAPSVARPVASAEPASTVSGNGDTRRIPVIKSSAVGNTATARQIPVNRPDTPGTARQTPVNRPDTPGTARQTPVNRPAESRVPATSAASISSTGDNGATRQIPAVRPAAPSSGTGAVRKPPVNRPAASVATSADSDNGATRQVPIVNPTAGAADSNEDAAATRPISTVDISSENNSGAGASAESTSTKKTSSADDTSSESKKKKSRGSGGSSVASIIKAVIYIVVVLVVSIGMSIAIILIGNDMYAFVKPDTPVEIVVPENADINDIADLLSANGIINYPLLFKWYAADHNDDGKFVAGTYTVSPATDYEDLLSAFKEQIPEGTTWVTIPEGFTTDEIIDLMVSKGIGTKEGYIDAINNYPYDYWFVQELDAKNWKSTGRIYRLDGYLFPDTYEFYNSSSEKTVIGRLLARFNMIYGEKYKEDAEKTGLTTDELIIIASMIEKEAGDASDYYLVSSVFHNRLKNPNYPALESDATVLYAIHHDKGERPNTVTPEDLELDTPYNTYRYHGLPPGPIANPSASAINAALAPENTGYYFFVSYGRETYFSSTKGEHDYYIAMIKEMIAAAENNNQG